MSFLDKNGLARLWANILALADTKVPNSRTVNGKALASDVVLSASDVGAATSSHTHDEATQDNAGFLSAENKIQLNNGGIPIATTSGTGAAYTATVNGLQSLVLGASLIIIPHVTSTSTGVTLNVNGLGAKQIRRRISGSTASPNAGYNSSWIYANKPLHVMYDGTYWIADLPKPVAADLSGTVAINKGGTGATTAEAALTNLGLTATAAELNIMDGVTATTTELNYVSGVTASVQDQLDAKVPNSRTINGKVLTSNVTLSASDIGAASSSHNHDDRYYTETEIDSKINDALNEAKIDSSNKDAVILAEVQEIIGNSQTQLDDYVFITVEDIDAICDSTIRFVNLDENSEVTF